MIARVALLLLLVTARAASAEPLTTVPTTLDPAKAYVLVEYKLIANTMANFPGSRKYYPQIFGLSFARYDATLADVRGQGRAVANPAPDKRPFEAFRNRPLVKGEGAQLFLIAVEPDTWVVQGWADTSFSLGSYRFQLAAGDIVDLGVVSALADWPDGQPPKAPSLAKLMLLGPFAKKPPVTPVRVSFRARGADDLPLPPELVARVRNVEFAPGATFGNYLGGPVNRIEGVNAPK
ncbi:hypothetical protein [Glacieibacterium frigidum]|uniref:GLPGLI family protein n=1 Tax=Glacieibacterium frigidum TaxID=2593303 RepID=A0A552UFB8_9SPHN|nr:hypothetical protein [Glacieibacterium frigidum]TRW16916.1 hypothetical protein FMM06_01525 [Glacieibacterium frigidum]